MDRQGRLEAGIGSNGLPWRALIILTGLNTLSYMDRQLLAFLALPIQRDLHLTDVQLGLLQGLAFSVVFVVASLAIGWAIDRFSRTRMLFLGVAIWSVATISCGQVATFHQLFSSRALVGVGEAVLAPLAYAVLAERTPAGRLAVAMAIYAIGASLGVALALIGGGAAIGALPADGLTLPLFGHLKPWQLAFVLLGTPGLLLAFAAFALPARPPRRVDCAGADGHEGTGFVKFLRTRRAALFCQQVGFAMLGLSSYAIVGWAPAFFGRVYGWTPAQVGPVLGVAVGLSGMIGMLVFGTVADRRFRRGREAAYFETHVVTTLIGAPIVVAAFLCGSPWLCASLLAVGFTFFFSFGAGSTAALQLITPPALRGRAGGLYLFTLNVLGLGVGPLVVGALTDRVFADRQMVGASVAVTVAGASAIAVLCLWLGQGAFRRAVRLEHPEGFAAKSPARRAI